MARTGLRVRASRPAKYKVRNYNRCSRCGRARAYLRLFALCRICFRDLALRGEVQGVTKSSW